MILTKPNRIGLYSRPQNIFAIVLVVSLIIIFSLVGYVYLKSQSARDIIISNQQESLTKKYESDGEVISKITLKKENGDFLEILRNGQINQYDAEGNLLKTGLLGYYQVNRLFEQIGQNLSKYARNYLGQGNYTLSIYTNKGTTVIVVNNGGSGGGDLDDVIDEIEDLEEGTLNPTPSPTPYPTQPGVNPPTPTPLVVITPSVIPTLTPTVGPGTPTPLPGYMTQDPFTCEDYANQLGKPMPISNIYCGLNPDSIQ